jgi:hypothetical protein
MSTTTRGLDQELVPNKYQPNTQLTQLRVKLKEYEVEAANTVEVSGKLGKWSHTRV